MEETALDEKMIDLYKFYWGVALKVSAFSITALGALLAFAVVHKDLLVLPFMALLLSVLVIGFWAKSLKRSARYKDVLGDLYAPVYDFIWLNWFMVCLLALFVSWIYWQVWWVCAVLLAIFLWEAIFGAWNLDKKGVHTECL